jgi:hypothetical protein
MGVGLHDLTAARATPGGGVRGGLTAARSLHPQRVAALAPTAGSVAGTGSAGAVRYWEEEDPFGDDSARSMAASAALVPQPRQKIVLLGGIIYAVSSEEQKEKLQGFRDQLDAVVFPSADYNTILASAKAYISARGIKEHTDV